MGVEHLAPLDVDAHPPQDRDIVLGIVEHKHIALLDELAYPARSLGHMCVWVGLGLLDVGLGVTVTGEDTDSPGETPQPVGLGVHNGQLTGLPCLFDGALVLGPISLNIGG